MSYTPFWPPHLSIPRIRQATRRRQCPIGEPRIELGVSRTPSERSAIEPLPDATLAALLRQLHDDLAEFLTDVPQELARLRVHLERLRGQTDSTRDWRTTGPEELVEHILRTFHDKHREQLPELLRLARRVEAVHGDKPGCPVGLADHLAFMEQDLESHMMKEEQVLFPMLIRGYYTQSVAPISMMRHEHEHHGESLEILMQLTNDITAPEGACNTWRALYAGLVQLREDVMQHIHLENNVLFLNAERQAGGH